MTIPENKLLSITHSLSTISQQSEDIIYWLGTIDFKHCIYLNPAYDKVFGYPRTEVFRDLKTIFNYLIPIDAVDYNPFLEMAERAKKDGPNTFYKEKYPLIRPDGHKRLIYDCGQPVYDKNGQHLGYSGIAHDITCEHLLNQLPLQSITSFPINDKKRYYLEGPYRKIYLTVREAECSFYLLQGKTAKQIAKLLQLSPRTIEAVMTNIKHKLCVNHKPELFEALIRGDFIKNFYL